MRRTAVAGLLILTLAVAMPFTGFLTARNAITNPCSGEAFSLQGGGPVPVSNPGARLEVRVASWNTFSGNSDHGVVSGLRAIGEKADVIGVQELKPESRRRTVERRLSGAWGISEANNSVQILWRRSRYQLLAQGSEKVFDVERIEDGVAGVSIGPKSVQWVQLKDNGTGAVFFVANHHIVPSIDRKGHPDTRNPRRLALYQRQMAALLGVVGQLRRYGPVFVTGDFNVDARRDARVADPSFPYAKLGAAGLSSNWRTLGTPSRGTHAGRRLIDYVWATTATATLTSQTILPKYGSDHNAVVVASRNPDRKAAAGVSTVVTATSKAPSQITVPGSTQGSTIVLGGEQITIASAIISEGKALGIPPQGWVVALATALQESGIRNLEARRPGQQRPVPAATIKWVGDDRPDHQRRVVDPGVLRGGRPHQQPRPDRHRRLADHARHPGRSGGPALRIP